jgi:protein-S-isoprenylcysteine O-methyltransferase Ste14
MNDTFEKIEGMTEHVKEYVQTRIQQTKLEIAEKTSGIIGNIIAVTVTGLLFVFVLLFGSIAGAWALSEWLGSAWAGFLIVAGFYLLLAIIVWFGRAGMIRFPVMNAIIKELNKKDKDDEHDEQKQEPSVN